MWIKLANLTGVPLPIESPESSHGDRTYVLQVYALHARKKVPRAIFRKRLSRMYIFIILVTLIINS